MVLYVQVLINDAVQWYQRDDKYPGKLLWRQLRDERSKRQFLACIRPCNIRWLSWRGLFSLWQDRREAEEMEWDWNYILRRTVDSALHWGWTRFDRGWRGKFVLSNFLRACQPSPNIQQATNVYWFALRDQGWLQLCNSLTPNSVIWKMLRRDWMRRGVWNTGMAQAQIHHNSTKWAEFLSRRIRRRKHQRSLENYMVCNKQSTKSRVLQWSSSRDAWTVWFNLSRRIDQSWDGNFQSEHNRRKAIWVFRSSTHFDKLWDESEQNQDCAHRFLVFWTDWRYWWYVKHFALCSGLYPVLLSLPQIWTIYDQETLSKKKNSWRGITWAWTRPPGTCE